MKDVVKWCLESREGPAAVARARALELVDQHRDFVREKRGGKTAGHHFGARGLDCLLVKRCQTSKISSERACGAV